MNGSRPITRILSCLFLAGLLLPVPVTADDSYRRIVALGDSPVDSGNVFVLTGRLAHKPYLPIPDAPYPIGGPQFSNGPTWVEQLAKRLGAGPSAGPSMRANGVFTNYAFGGARAGAALDTFTSLTAQVTMFLDDFGDQVPADALYAIAIGGNDLRDALDDPANAVDDMEAALEIYALNLGLLIEAGARHFVIANLPNLAAVPALADLGDDQLAQVYLLSLLANMALESMLMGFDAGSDAEIEIIDAFGLTTDLADPTIATGLGFPAGTMPCLTFRVKGNAICNDRDAHFYWDGIHPTRAGHALIAQLALDAVTAD